MKPVNILLLVLAGALGGAVVMKVAQRPKTQTAMAEAPAPASPTQPVAAAPLETPVAPAVVPPAVPEPAAAPKDVKPLARKRQTAPRLVYSDARPSPFHKEPAAVQVAQAAPPAAPPAPMEQTAPPVQPQPEAAIPARAEPEQETPPAPPQPVPHTATLNAGMLIPVRLVDGLSSERNAAGDAFLATLDRELVADGFVIAERGARVEGRVVTVDRGTKVHGGATLVVELTRLHTSDRQTVDIQTESFEKRSEPNSTTDAEKVGGGAAIGAIIGAIAGGGKGAAVGAGAGAGAGAGDVLLTRKPATLPSETRITFRLRNAVTLTEKFGG